MGKKRGAAAGKGVQNTCGHVQVLGSGADVGGVPAAMLVFDNRRFLFNVPEGFQRFAAQHKIKLTKISQVLLTQSTMEAAGGLPGMLLTIGAASDSASLELSGLERTNHLIRAMDSFMNTRDYKVYAKLFNADCPEPAYQDEVVSIQPVVLSATTEGGAGAEAEASFATDCEEPAAKRPKTEASGSSRTGRDAVCYVAKLADIPGRFLPVKAAELGVPRGPSYAQLVKGNAVELPDGTKVLPQQVMEPAMAGPMVFVVDCPTVAHIPALLASKPLSDKAALAQDDGERPAVCLIHFSPREVVADERYKAWMHGFGEGPTHIMAGLATGRTVLISAARLQSTLNQLDSDVFPLHSSLSEPGKEELPDGLPTGAVLGESLLKFHLRPVSRIGLDTSQVKDGALSQAAELAAKPAEGDDPELAALVEQVRKSRESSSLPSLPRSLQGLGRQECEITLLGTGSAIPSKYRNVTGLHVNLFEAGGFMLDCGEDSFGQLVRRFGAEEANRIVCNLKLVWISHIHADHHVGLSRLLLARQTALGPGCPALPVIGPAPLRRSLNSFRVFGALEYKWIDGTHLLPPEQQPEWWTTDPGVKEQIRTVMASLGLKNLQNVRAEHCAHAFGVVFEGSKGWKVVFSGDTRPCPQMVAASQGADLLIHEATFDDDMAEEAHAKRHSMTFEAVKVGADAGVFRTLLTHFSQRYPKIPIIAPSFRDSTCIAFDLMTVNLADVHRLPTLIPAIGRLFKDVVEEGDDDNLGLFPAGP